MRGTLLAFVGAVWALSGCGGPERAPSQPIGGVDRSHEDVNPHDVDGQTVNPTFLGTFVEDVTKAVQGGPAMVAVFPALTFNQDQQIRMVNGLGEHLAEETATRLADGGVKVLADSDLVNAVRGANLRLTNYGSEADAVAMAQQIKADYVVTGKADKKTFDIHHRDEALEIDWLCRRVADGGIVARWRAQMKTGPLANDLFRYYRMEGEWESKIRQDRPAAPKPGEP